MNGRSPASHVFIVRGALFMQRPGSIVFHEQNRARSTFPTYSSDDGKFTTHKEGEERHSTFCGLVTYWGQSPTGPGRRPWDAPEKIRRDVEAVRLDIAELLGRPCRVCFRG